MHTMQILKKLFSSKVRAQVIGLLFADPPAELHLREMTRRSGLALRTIQRDLEKLLEIDLIQSHRDGNRVVYRANREHPLFSELAGIVAKSTGIVPVLRERLLPLKEKREASVAFVFGSVARNAEKGRSDIDVMIIGSVGLRTVAKLLSGLSEKFGREINPHILTEDEFRKRRKTRNHFLNRVLDQPKDFLIGDENELKVLG